MGFNPWSLCIYKAIFVSSFNIICLCVFIPFPLEGEFPKTVQQAKVPLISSTSCRSYWGLDIKNTNICGGAAGSSSCMVMKACVEEGRSFLLSVSHEWVFADHKKV